MAHDAFLNQRITIELPNGNVLKGKVPSYAEGKKMLQILHRVDQGEPAALLEVCEQFPTLIEVPWRSR
jgi:hypothetical protein